MKTSLRKDSRGIATVAIVLVVVVVAAIAGVGYYVFSKNKKDNGTATVTNSQVSDACNKLYNDKDLCKFAGSYTGKGPYKASFTNKDKSGVSSTMTMEVDAKDNSSIVSSENGKEVAAYISLNGDTYMKDETDGSWTKYPKSPETPATTSPTSDLNVDFTGEAAKAVDQRIVYKKLGKEACGKSTCLKYQVIDPSQPNTESILWFGTKDYQLHQWSFKDADGATSIGTFTYTSVTINVPSPVKDAASATPSAAEIQQAIDAAAAAGQ